MPVTTRGRCGIGLERDLREAPAIGPAERAHLRTVALAIDLAANASNLELVDRLSRTYLDLRLAAGLSANSPAKPATDPWDRLANVLSDPGLRNPTDAHP